MKKQLWMSGIAAVVVGLAVVALKAQPVGEELDPVKLMPDNHKVIFENAFVRVIDSRVPAGGAEVRHWHPHSVTISLSDYDAYVTTFPDDKTTHFHRTAGTASWNEAGMHAVRIGPGAASHQIRVELKY